MICETQKRKCERYNHFMGDQKGKIIIEPGTNVWEHELRTADALAKAGFIVTFIKKSDIEFEKTADTLIDGFLWEFKSPTADKLKAIERNLKRGRWQSENIVFDSRRMKKIPDHVIEHEVRKQAYTIPRISRLLYVNKHGRIIDIK